jgi:hypothetical protein
MKMSKLQMTLSYMIVAVGIGSIAVTLSLLFALGLTDVLKQILVWLIASAIIGIVSMIYESERLTDLTATCLHAPATCLVALCSGWILDYGDGSLVLLVSRMLPTIVFFYAAIHLILFLFRRASAADINTRLQKK